MKKITSSYWFWFSPYLLLFICIVLKFHKDEMIGDEQRYMDFAHNLCHGFYSPGTGAKLNLWNGPGYPIVLMPFVALKTPLIFITLFNSLLQYLSIIFLYRSLLIISNKKAALCFALFWASYFVSYQEMPNIVTETFTSFLITLIIFLVVKSFTNNSNKYLAGAGISLGFLVLTKVAFGYVLLFSILIYVCFYLVTHYLLKRKLKPVRNILIIMLIALGTITPYMVYTYSLTGKMFYFGNSGGVVLYWMSTPYEHEYGEWNSDTFDAYCKDGLPCNAEFIAKNHTKDFDIINQYTGVDRDDAFKKIAIENIKTHPLKYVRNWFSNLGRIWFGYPSSAFYQQDIILVRFIPNSIILTFFLLCFPFWIINFKKCSTEINFLVIFIFIYLGATTLVSAYPRQLFVVVPVLLIWMASLLHRLVTIKVKME
ncbi:MAG: glycosyltransferase family 39 protein [Ferruginibacter sp.]